MAASKISAKEKKFMPNLKQIKEAAEQLPDPQFYSNETYTSRVVVDKDHRELDFHKQKIQRGSRLVSRWVYEGKILIRNRDQKEKES
ncbi:MAG: hypothetical protein ACON46_02265 [Coraliomargaritaceae bacterium]